MQYKTIVLALIQRKLLATLDLYSQQLKSRHEFWKVQLSQVHPESNPTQIASQAGELALEELVASLPPVSETSGEQLPLSYPPADLPPA
jgi:hypothetical protein